MALTDMDRRTALARYALPGPDLDRHEAVLAEVKQRLEGLDDRTRRKGLLLVTALAAQWSLLDPTGGETMELVLDCSPERLRIRASASPSALPVQFWEVVGGAAATTFADRWERDRAGASFEIEIIA